MVNYECAFSQSELTNLTDESRHKLQSTENFIDAIMAPQLISAGGGVRSLFSTKWFWVFVSGGVVLFFFEISVSS